MAVQGLTFRRLAEITKTLNPARGLTHGYLVGAAQGDERLSADAIETVAAALGRDPWSIIEYRLAYYRRTLDERPPPHGVGPKLAAVQLRLIEAAGLAPAEPGEDPAAAMERAADDKHPAPPATDSRTATPNDVHDEDGAVA